MLPKPCVLPVFMLMVESLEQILKLAPGGVTEKRLAGSQLDLPQKLIDVG